VDNNKIAVVIPCHNNLDVLKSSIPAIFSDSYTLVVFDDGSSDGTKLWLKDNFPHIHVLSGDGSNWWTGSLAKSVDYCKELGFEYLVSLNADVLISPQIVKDLLRQSRQHGDAIIASVVVDVSNPETILWAGSSFGKIHNLVPIYVSRYIVKSGTHVSKLPEKVYQVDEIHGRGVLLPMSVFKQIGNYDRLTFPQYGGDTDFSLRAKRHGVKMFVDPSCVAQVFVQNTSLNRLERLTFREKLLSIKHYLFDRKNGEALYVWWNLYKKHLPYAYLLQSFCFVILLNVYRKIVR
jgi:GT2 family glycosyltransferase